MEPTFCIKITEIDGSICPLHWLRKNTAKYKYKTYIIHSKKMPNFGKKVLAPFLCTKKFILYVLNASGI